MANKSVADRLGGVEAALQNVQQLANATAKGVGKDRALRQQVCFCQGGFRATVEEALQRWQDGAKEVKAEGSASASAAAAPRPLPFKFQFFSLVVGQLEEQGMDAEVARGLKELRPEETVEALQFKEPPEDVSKAWVVVLLFKATWSGMSAWALLNSPPIKKVVAKRDGAYPQLGLRQGRFVPGPIQRRVLEDLGHTSEEVRSWFAGGKGSSGKGGGGERGAGQKRGAGTRLSVSEGRDKKRIETEAEKAMQGVGFLLNSDMQRAWKDADQFCEYGGGRLMRIRLCVKGRFFSVISCYAPTFRCFDEEKEEFYEALGEMVDKIPQKDEIVVLGGFNARVGLANEVRGFINKWWVAKVSEIQARVDAKDHNYQFAGYKELRRVLAIGRKSPCKLRDAKGNLILTRLISILREYYSGKKARISVEGGLSEEFDLETGLGQGCCVAPLLFNIFLAAVVEAWVGESGGGVHWLTRIGGALLHGEVQGKYSSWEALDLHELGYADDAALIADTLSQLRGVAKGFQLHLREWGLQLSVEKTEAMSSAPGARAPIPVEEFEGFDAVKFSEYFELELASGGREALARTLMTEVRERVRANPEVDMEELCCDLVECFQGAETEGDLAMFRLLVSTVLLSPQANLTEFSRSPYTGDDAKAILDGTAPPKYWNLRNAVTTRVDALETQVRNVACLASATAKRVGEDKVPRQWVAFVQGPCRAKLEEICAGWKDGASRAREGVAAATSGESKVVPFKLQVFNLFVEQLAEQGLDKEVLGGLRGFRPGGSRYQYVQKKKNDTYKAVIPRGAKRHSFGPFSSEEDAARAVKDFLERWDTGDAPTTRGAKREEKHTKSIQLQLDELNVNAKKVAHAAAKGVFLAGVGEFESFLDRTSNSSLAMLVPQTPKVRSILQSRGVEFAERLATPDAQFEAPVPTVEVAIDIEIHCIDPCMQRGVDKNARYAFKQIVHAAFSEQIVSECYSVFVRASVLQGIIKIPVSQLINVLRRPGPDGIFAKEKWRAQPVQLPLALIHQSQLREKNWDNAVKAASELSGFAGVHRSATGSKSLRFDDKGIAKARETLCVSGLYSDDNISVVATHFFQVQGIPSGTAAAAVCAGLRQWGWTVIPVKSWPLSPTHAIWLVGSATEPPGKFLVLQDVTVTVVKDGPSTRQSTTPSKSVPVDPLRANDPWARFTRASLSVQTVVESRVVGAEKRLADQMQSMLTSARLEFEEQLEKLRQDQASVMQTSGPQTDVDARVTSAEQRIADQMQTTFQSMRQELGQQCDTLRQEQASSSKLLADTVSHVRQIEANVVGQVQDLKTQQQAGVEERLLAAIASSGAKPSPSRKAPRAT
ncbi:unnamed protein product [Symbiodinium sp. CCMP2456]|nr:unnamed protein product [Symbiodinium sp. CCMP2456]